MKREEVFSVKIYFVKPVDLIAVVVNTLLELEYETYTVAETDAEALLKILPSDQRAIVFLSVSNKHEVGRWVEYARKVQAIKGAEGGAAVQVGAFAYSSMDADERQKFLYQQIPTISFASLTENAVQTLEKILTVFDARGVRRYVRVKARGMCVAFFAIKGRTEPLRCNLTEISAYAILCEVPAPYHQHFGVGTYLNDVMLALRGVHARSTVKVVGFSRENANVFILKLCGMDLLDGKMVYSDNVPAETRRKVHACIRTCLTEELDERLAAAGRN